MDMRVWYGGNAMHDQLNLLSSQFNCSAQIMQDLLNKNADLKEVRGRVSLSGSVATLV